MSNMMRAAKSSLLATVVGAFALFVTTPALAKQGEPSAVTDMAEADQAPALGLLVPVGPPDYQLIFSALKDRHDETFGPFIYHVGTIAGVRVIVSIAPQEGPLLRSLAAQEMLHHYPIKAFIYPGTSGAHLGPDKMRIGDIVLGAVNVDIGNFFMAKDGSLVADEFGHAPIKTKPKRFEAIYLDPTLLGKLACSAQRVAKSSDLPTWLNPEFPRSKPDIFYYGIQGTSTMWLGNKEFMAKIDGFSHAMDEDGDFYSAVVATLYHIPFIEVSTISDSILELPQTDRGLPVTPAGGDGANFMAQRISNRVALDFIKRNGAEVLRGSYSTPHENPYSAAALAAPKQSGGLPPCPN